VGKSTVAVNLSLALAKTGARVGIMDADMGMTTSNLSKYSILQQTGIAALQQSDQMQQGVLKLIQS